MSTSIIEQPLKLSKTVYGTKENTNLVPWTPTFEELVTTLFDCQIGNKDGTYYLRCGGTERKGASVDQIAHLLVLDGDSRIGEDGETVNGAPDPKLVHGVLTNLGLSHVIVPSHSNREDLHKYRVLIPCEYTHDTGLALYYYLFSRLHEAGVMLTNVKENMTWAQAWYFPRVPDNERLELFKKQFVCFKGTAALDVEAIYAEFKVEQLKQPKKAKPPKDTTAEQAEGIAAFNKQYPLQQVLIHYGYKFVKYTREGERWISPNSKSREAGLILNYGFDNEASTVWSNHQNDPLNDGKLHDAFDVYRLLGCDGDSAKAFQWDTAAQKARQSAFQEKQFLEGLDVTQEQLIEHGNWVANAIVAQYNLEQDSKRKEELSTFKKTCLFYGDLEDMEFEPTPFIIDKILPAGTTLFSGKPKKGKSFLALGMSVCVAAGRDVFGYKTTKSKVLYLGLEDNFKRLQSRIGILVNKLDFLPNEIEDVRRNLVVQIVAPKFDAGFENVIKDWMETHPDTGLIVVDILAKVRKPGRANAQLYEIDYAVGEGFKSITALYPKLAILPIHHSRKTASTDPLDAHSGSLGLAGSFDNSYVLIDDEKVRTLHVTGRDIEDSPEIGLDMDDRGFYTFGEVEPFDTNTTTSDTRKKVFDMIPVAPATITPKHIAELTGLVGGTVRQHLLKLIKSHSIIKTDRGDYQRI